jgi:hypothetical protein
MHSRKVCLLGDTANSEAIAPLAAGCDLLSHESTFLHNKLTKARIARHSTGQQAGDFAARIAARQLVLTHFSGRYGGGGEQPALPNSDRAEQEVESDQWALQRLREEASAAAGGCAPVACAFDGFTWRLAPQGYGQAAPLEPQWVQKASMQFGPSGRDAVGLKRNVLDTRERPGPGAIHEQKFAVNRRQGATSMAGSRHREPYAHAQRRSPDGVLDAQPGHGRTIARGTRSRYGHAGRHADNLFGEHRVGVQGLPSNRVRQSEPLGARHTEKLFDYWRGTAEHAHAAEDFERGPSDGRLGHSKVRAPSGVEVETLGARQTDLIGI